MEKEKVFSLKPCIDLVNHFRSFTHEKHEFVQGYLQTTLELLHAIKAEIKLESKVEAQLQSQGLILNHFILIFHYILASVGNIEELLKSLNSKAEVVAIPKSQVNKTNILNVHTLIDAISRLTPENKVGGMNIYIYILRNFFFRSFPFRVLNQFFFLFILFI